MKLKNKIYILISVFTLVGLTHSFTLKDLNAALTAPSSYDINYRYNSVDDDTFGLGTTSWPTYFPLYTRTADSTYFNYTTTIDNSDTSILPLGLEITMTFNRSNSLWYSFGGGYLPDDTKIGSDSTVGTVDKKVYLEFDNQTSKNYNLLLDTSSTSSGYGYFIIMNTISLRVISTSNTSALKSHYISSYSTLQIEIDTTGGARYLDAWYLQDLGVSASYDAGYEQGDIDGYADGLGNNPNVLLNGFQAMVGILVNFMLMIVNLEVFGVSLINVFSILALFVGIVWILKIIRG
jgi:hypothetical protein